MHESLERDDLVVWIVDALKPLKSPRAAVEGDVRRAIDMARKHIAGWKGDHSANKLHAEQLDKALAEVEALLGPSVPEPLASAIMLKLLSDGDPVARQITRRVAFSDILRDIREVCGSKEAKTYGHHPNVNVANKVCVASAARLMHRRSKNRPTSGQDSKFHTIAGLLYEAVTGDKPGKAGLRRACNDFVRLAQMRP